MHFSTALLSVATLVSIASAQTTAAVPTVPAVPTGAATGQCEGQNVLTACLSSTTAIAQACQSTDYSCLCNAWNAVLTCYNECPNDAGYAGALSNKQTYCNNASLYQSTSSSAISRDWPTSTTADSQATGDSDSGSGSGNTGAAKGASTTGGSKTASATKASSSDQNSGARERVMGGMVGVLGGVGAVAAVFL